MLDELRELYQEVILDHGKNPRNFGRPDGVNRQAEGYNPLCGDRLTVYVSLADDGRIADAAFEGKGCAISVASASLLTEVLKGRTVAEADALFDSFHRLCTDDAFDPDDVAALDEEAFERLQVLSGVKQFPVRVKCATLAWHTLHAALHGEGRTTTE
jgi:nitrogen fixation NifU-like protein